MEKRGCGIGAFERRKKILNRNAEQRGRGALRDSFFRIQSQHGKCFRAIGGRKRYAAGANGEFALRPHAAGQNFRADVTRCFVANRRLPDWVSGSRASA